MCGILGAISTGCSIHGFTKALNTLSHRGPDGYGVWNDKNQIFFGHRRLSIIDLSDAGKQPMVYDDRYVITFNGEIYNFEEIKRELQMAGFVFKTGSDTEVLLIAYVYWGSKCLEHFNGMWAFGIWDKKEQTLFLSRDRFGVKPLFYAQIEDKLIFASEMKAVLPFLKEKKVSQYFQWCYQNQHEYEGTDRTLIEGIKRFPAGHYATFSFTKGEFLITRYWDTIKGFELNVKPYKIQVEEFKALFEDACRLRLVSDVPVATALSGGIDSSVISASLKKVSQNSISSYKQADFKVFSASFPGSDELDEIEYAIAVADHLNIPLNTLPIASNFTFNSLIDSIWKFEELYETTPLPMMALYNGMSKQNYKVSIDGHGGDELFAGYGHAVFQIVKDNPFNIRLINELIETYKAMYARDSNKKLLHLIDAFGGRKNLIVFYLSTLFKKKNPKIKEVDNFNNYLFLIFHKSILPTLLRNYDRYSMSSGVEVRMPFLDYRLVQYSFNLGWSSKIRNGYTKAIVRDAFEKDLPEKVIRRRRKVGFSSPMNKWFEGSWNSIALDIVNSKAFVECPLIQEPKLAQAKLSALLEKKKLTFKEGFMIWNGLQPYLWETYFLKEAQKISAYD